MTEYKILRGQPEELQKILNQWRHQYFLTIEGIVSQNDTIVIILIRESKDKKGE